jgi:phage terminase Nu1 subunit (DNA packaging protein)
MTNLKSGADVETVARVNNITTRYVQSLSKLPGFPAKYQDGSYDLNKFALAYIRHMQAEMNRRGDAPEPAELRAARLRLLRAQAERVRLHNDIRSGKLVRVVDVSNTLARRLINCRDRLRGMGAALGPQLTNKPREYIEDRLRVGIEQALAELDGPICPKPN